MADPTAKNPTGKSVDRWEDEGGASHAYAPSEPKPPVLAKVPRGALALAGIGIGCVIALALRRWSALRR